MTLFVSNRVSDWSSRAVAIKSGYLGGYLVTMLYHRLTRIRERICGILALAQRVLPVARKPRKNPGRRCCSIPPWLDLDSNDCVADLKGPEACPVDEHRRSKGQCWSPGTSTRTFGCASHASTI